MGKNNFRKIATITLFESAVQWYCFLLYGTAAGTVFNKVFFSQTGNGTTALILSYMSFAEKGFQFFQNFLKTTGILDELEAAGIQEGDTVRMYGLKFDYYK